jgi:hypothetical protein
VDSTEIIVHIVDRNRVPQVLQLLTESVGQARETAHAHSHREVLPFHITGAHMFRDGISAQYPGTASDAGCVALTGKISPNAYIP